MIKKLCLFAEIFILAAIGACQQDAGNSDPVEKFWKQKEAIVSSALNGITMGDRQYLDACIFFERTTGITLRGDGTYFGWAPNEHTREDFKCVQEWYKHNKGKLCW